jgi:hypothetical protein
MAILLAFVFEQAACDEKTEPGLPFCDGPTRVIYAPETGDYDSFPDDYFSVEDPTTHTGRRVAMVPGVDLTVSENIAIWDDTFHDLSTVDGFGTTSAVTLRVSGPVDPESLPAGGEGGEGSGQPGGSLVLVALDEAPPRFVDFTLEIVPEGGGDPGVTLVLTPTAPLRPGARHGVALTSEATDAEGRCLAPSASFRALMDGRAPTPRLGALAPRLEAFAAVLVDAGTIASAADLAHAQVFTTQSTVPGSVAVAKAIREMSPAYRSLGPCAIGSLYRECEGELDAFDFRVDGRAVDDASPAPERAYLLPVTTWLPLEPAPAGEAYPTLVFGHGLSGDRHQAARLARYAAPLGWAVVAVDAVKHGDHPDQPEMQSALRVLEFFGISTSMNPPLDGLALRDNFRQSTYDKLQLVRALAPGLDVDDDGTPDIDQARLGYLGVSLGGLMSAELVTLAPEIGIAVIIVPGARVGSIIQHGPLFSVLVELLRGEATDGQVARFFPLLQTVIDRGDPGAWGLHVAAARLPGFEADVQVLMQMVLDDEVVPNVSNVAFAQALAAPLAGDALLPVPGLAAAPALPYAGNLRPGVTAGLFQFDVVPTGPATGLELEPATHDNVADSAVGLEQSLHFLESWRATGIAELIDPYRELGIKE